MAENLDAMPHILVMSDNPEEIESIKSVLEEKEYTIDTTSNGFEGLEIARSTDLGLIITSLKLTQISGAKIAKLLKFDKKYKDVPILSIIGDSSDEQLEKIRELKIDRFITRPISQEQLLISVRNLFSESEIGGFIEETLL